MVQTATAQTSAFVLATVKRMRALVLQSTQDLIDQAQTPVAKDGKMRVDTGFLRASGQASLTGMPSGPGLGRKRTADEPDDTPLYETQPVEAMITQISGFNLGQTIYFGWTAKYAKYREAFDGFLATAVQNWQTIVSKNTAEIQRRSPGATDQS
jgi:hypothetical protein